MIKRIRAGLVLALLLCLAPAIYAQSITGTVTGTVTDPQGAVIPGANILLHSEGSGGQRRTVSNAEGYFTIAAVPAGSYTVVVEITGFQKYELRGFAFNGADKRNLDIKLQIATSTETVQVAAAAGVRFDGRLGRKIRSADKQAVAGLLGSRPQCG